MATATTKVQVYSPVKNCHFCEAFKSDSSSSTLDDSLSNRLEMPYTAFCRKSQHEFAATGY